MNKQHIIFFLLSILLLTACSDDIFYKQEKKGVYYYNKSKSYHGYNVIECNIMNMKGEIFAKITPGSMCVFNIDGSTIMNIENKIWKYNKHQNLLWALEIPGHNHELTADQKSIWTLGRSRHKYRNGEYLHSYIYRISQKGKLISRWHSKNMPEQFIKQADKLENGEEVKEYIKRTVSHRKKQIRNALAKKGGVELELKINSLQSLPETYLSKNYPQFRAGNLLVNFDMIGLFVILDPNSYELLWAFPLPNIFYYSGAHTLRMLKNGNMLVFINKIYYNDRKNFKSRIVEFNPLTKQIVWEYEDPENFHAKLMGSCQRLPNGNTLVSHISNDTGNAFEITPDKEIVWKWRNPVIDPKTNKSALVYRMWRFDKEEIPLPEY